MITYSYTIVEFEEYDKEGFETKEQALKSAVRTVRNLQKNNDDLLLSQITLLTNAERYTNEYKDLKRFEKEELR